MEPTKTLEEVVAQVTDTTAVAMTKDTFMLMDLIRLQAWFTAHALDGVKHKDVDDYHRCFDTFNKLGREAVCVELAAGGYKRQINLQPYTSIITVEQLRYILTQKRELQDYRTFSVEFLKKDDTYRKMSCHFVLPEQLKGGKKTYDDLAKGLCTVWDLEKQEVRSFTIANVIRATIGETRYYVKENEHLLSKLPEAVKLI